MPDRSLKWIYATADNAQLEQRYDEWADSYDDTLADWGWRGPQFCVEALARHVPPQRAEGAGGVLDVGAGTGLVGVALHAAGYRDIHGIDLSQAMLDEAARKGVYRDLRRMTLGERLDFADGTFAACISVGVFTPGHAPVSALWELARITAAGGVVVLLARTDMFAEHGLDALLAEMVAAGVIGTPERSEPRVALPNEPDAHTHHTCVLPVR